MKTVLFTLSLLASSLSIHTSDENSKNALHLNLNNKSLTDPAFSSILAAAPYAVTFSAQHHQLLAPQLVKDAFKCEFLTELDLSNGDLMTFPIGAFAGAMPALKKLNLAHNQIISIASKNDEDYEPPFIAPIWRWNSKSLQELDVSHNQLTIFDLTIINNAPNLTSANFSHNTITEIKIPKWDVGEGGCLNHRQTCTVQLQNTLLKSAHRELLEKHSARTTEQYEAAITRGTGTTLIFSTAAALIGTLGLEGFMMLCANNVELCMGYLFINMLVAGPYIDYIIARRNIPENQRTYKQLIFKFEPAKSL